MGDSSEPLSPQSTKTNQRRVCSSADLFFSALQRPAAGGEGCRSASGATKSRRGRDSCKGPRISFPVFRTCNVRNCLNALLCSQGGCSKSFWDLPPPHSPPGHINPKTIWNNSIPHPLWPFRVVCVALFVLFPLPGFPVSYTACSVCMETEAESAAIRTDADNPK